MAEGSSPAKARPALTHGSASAGTKPERATKQEHAGSEPSGKSARSRVLVTEGPLGAALFERQLRRSLPMYDSQCWDRLRVPVGKVAPDPSVRIEFEVDPRGDIHQITSSRPPAGYRGVGRCVIGRMRGWSFPSADEPTRVVVTVAPLDP